MSLQGLYASQMLREIKQIAIWRPGDVVAPGDVGYLREGAFEKQTNLSRLFPELKFAVADVSLHNPYRFVSNSCTLSSIEASASPLGGLNGSGSLKISFGNKGGVIFEATDIVKSSIDDLYQIRQFISSHRVDWPKDMVLAATTESAGSFRVLVSETENGSATLRGNVSALGTVSLTDASISVSMDHSSGYDSHLARGVIAVTGYGFGWWNVLRRRISSMEHRDKHIEQADFVELSAEEFPADAPIV
jgi:hypothetical protein